MNCQSIRYISCRSEKIRRLTQLCAGLMLAASAGRAQQNIPTAAFVKVTPCRLVDTRASLGGTTLKPGETETFAFGSSSSCPLPSNVYAYSLNVTVIPKGPLSYLTIWPTGAAQPVVSTLNSPSGDIIANAAIVPAGTSGSVNVFAPSATDLIVDINGYFAAQGSASGGQTVLGVDALPAQSGSLNTAIGFATLSSNTSGTGSTALGASALQFNTSGSYNTAGGYNALSLNSTGSYNTAFGSSSMYYNQTGSDNSAFGINSLLQNFAGSDNSGVGSSALRNLSTGSSNTAVGRIALENLTTGDTNTALGFQAGVNLTTESNNVDIANEGTAGDSGVIRIGTLGKQSSIYVPAVALTALPAGVPVGVNPLTGQLGIITTSSRRFKENVSDMGDASDALMDLRPVTFRYKQQASDGSKPLQYGLIAEELAEKYPDLVVKGSDNEPLAIKEQEVSWLLLNELQKQHRALAQQTKTINELQQQLKELEEKSGTAGNR